MWDKMDMLVFGSKNAALNLLADWRKTQLDNAKYKPVVSSSDKRWNKFQRDRVQVNIDATVFMQNHAIGIGGIILDENENFLRAGCQRVVGLWHPEKQRLLVLRS